MIVAIAKKIRDHLGGLNIGKMVEQKFIQNAQYSHPPIFIVGLPRSGTTLLYQILIEQFEATYFSNVASVFVSYPSIVAYFTKKYQNSAQIDSFNSEYGVTPGLFSPSEAGGIYRYWLKLDEQERCWTIKHTIYKISETYNRPFVLKNLNLSNEIVQLNNLFPNALFIKIDRDIEYVIQSIYKKIRKGDSIDVAGFESIDANGNLIEQITREALLFDNKINQKLKNVDVNTIEIQYETLCDDFEEVLSKIETAYRLSGYKLHRKKGAMVSNLSVRNEKRIGSEEWEQIEKSLKHLEMTNN